MAMEITKTTVNRQTKQTIVTVSFSDRGKHINLRLEEGLEAEKADYADNLLEMGLLGQIIIRKKKSEESTDGISKNRS